MPVVIIRDNIIIPVESYCCNFQNDTKNDYVLEEGARTDFPPSQIMFSRLVNRAPIRLSQISKQFTHQTRRMAYAYTKLKLNNGGELPAIGFGTWQDKDAQEEAVYEAVKAGYRHIDTARVYVSSNSPIARV